MNLGEKAIDCRYGQWMSTKSLQLRMVLVPARLASKYGPCQQGFTPKRDQALGIQIARMKGPEAHRQADVRSGDLGRHGRAKGVGLGLPSCDAAPEGEADEDNECGQRHCGVELSAEADAMRPDEHGGHGQHRGKEHQPAGATHVVQAPHVQDDCGIQQNQHAPRRIRRRQGPWTRTTARPTRAGSTRPGKARATYDRWDARTGCSRTCGDPIRPASAARAARPPCSKEGRQASAGRSGQKRRTRGPNSEADGPGSPRTTRRLKPPSPRKAPPGRSRPSRISAPATSSISMQTSSRFELTSALMSSMESGCWPAGVGQNEKKKWLAPFTSIHAPKIKRAARASCLHGRGLHGAGNARAHGKHRPEAGDVGDA